MTRTGTTCESASGQSKTLHNPFFWVSICTSHILPDETYNPNYDIDRKRIDIFDIVRMAGVYGISQPDLQYDPNSDLDGDGDIDIFDIVKIAGSYGTTGTPYEAKAALEYDSGWIDITDQRGQSLNVTHGLNRTDIMVGVTGKAAVDAEPHQNFYGLTTHMVADPGWNCTLGGGRPFSMVQTSDGGYAIIGSRTAFVDIGDWNT